MTPDQEYQTRVIRQVRWRLDAARICGMAVAALTFAARIGW